MLLLKCEVVLFQISLARLLGLLHTYLFNKYLLNAILLSTVDSAKKYQIRPLPYHLFQEKKLKRHWQPSTNTADVTRLNGWVAKTAGAGGSAKGRVWAEWQQWWGLWKEGEVSKGMEARMQEAESGSSKKMKVNKCALTLKKGTVFWER